MDACDEQRLVLADERFEHCIGFDGKSALLVGEELGDRFGIGGELGLQIGLVEGQLALVVDRDAQLGQRADRAVVEVAAGDSRDRSLSRRSVSREPNSVPLCRQRIEGGISVELVAELVVLIDERLQGAGDAIRGLRHGHGDRSVEAPRA